MGYSAPDRRGRHLGASVLDLHPLRWRLLRVQDPAAVCTATGLPLAWQVETAKDAEAPMVPVLLDRLRGHRFPVENQARQHRSGRLTPPIRPPHTRNRR